MKKLKVILIIKRIQIVIVVLNQRKMIVKENIPDHILGQYLQPIIPHLGQNTKVADPGPLHMILILKRKRGRVLNQDLIHMGKQELLIIDEDHIPEVILDPDQGQGIRGLRKDLIHGLHAADTVTDVLEVGLTLGLKNHLDYEHEGVVNQGNIIIPHLNIKISQDLGKGHVLNQNLEADHDVNQYLQKNPVPDQNLKKGKGKDLALDQNLKKRKGI